MKVENINITVNNSNKIEMTSTTEGVSIYYTLDGAEPSSSSTLYSEAIDYTTKKLIKAIGILEGYDNSDIAEYLCYKLLTQYKINESNKIYKITDDYDLGGKTITIPEGCTLYFLGGSFSNGILIGNNTNIESISKYYYILNVTLLGDWKINEGYPEWFGAAGDGVTDDRVAIQTAVDNCDIVYFRNTKYKLGIIYYSAGGQGNLFIKKNVKLLGNDTEFILDGQGLIFTPLGYSNNSIINEEYRNKNIELITEDVTYLSNVIKVNDTSKFTAGDTILIRGEDSRINTDYEECDQWDINTIKLINDDNTIELMSPIGFNIDLTKCNRTGGISNPSINGSIIKVSITSLVIDGFKFGENQSSSVFRFDHCINVKLSNIKVINKNIVSFKHCANININNITHEYNHPINTKYSTLSMWGVKNCYIGNIIRHDCGITNNLNTVRLISTEGRNYNIYAELIDFTTDIENTSTISCIYGDDIYINKLRITCNQIDVFTVSGNNTFVNYLEIYGCKRLVDTVKSVYNISKVYDKKTVFNNILLIYYDIENQKRDYYSFNVNKIVCSKRYAIISGSSINIKDDLFSNGDLCLIGSVVDTNAKINSIKLQNSYMAIEGIKSEYRKFSQVVSYLFTEDSKTLKNFYITLDTEEEISKDNPVIIELFFTSLFHYIEKLDEDNYWDNSNLNTLGNYSNNILTIKDYPFSNFENNIFLMNNRHNLNKIKGTTEQRPTLTSADDGFEYYDTTLKKKILWNGIEWTNLDGTSLT